MQLLRSHSRKAKGSRHSSGEAGSSEKPEGAWRLAAGRRDALAGTAQRRGAAGSPHQEMKLPVRYRAASKCSRRPSITRKALEQQEAPRNGSAWRQSGPGKAGSQCWRWRRCPPVLQTLAIFTRKTQTKAVSYPTAATIYVVV